MLVSALCLAQPTCTSTRVHEPKTDRTGTNPIHRNSCNTPGPGTPLTLIKPPFHARFRLRPGVGGSRREWQTHDRFIHRCMSEGSNSKPVDCFPELATPTASTKKIGAKLLYGWQSTTFGGGRQGPATHRKRTPCFAAIWAWASPSPTETGSTTCLQRDTRWWLHEIVHQSS